MVPVYIGKLIDKKTKTQSNIRWQIFILLLFNRNNVPRYLFIYFQEGIIIFWYPVINQNYKKVPHV